MNVSMFRREELRLPWLASFLMYMYHHVLQDTKVALPHLHSRGYWTHAALVADKRQKANGLSGLSVQDATCDPC